LRAATRMPFWEDSVVIGFIRIREGRPLRYPQKVRRPDPRVCVALTGYWTPDKKGPSSSGTHAGVTMRGPGFSDHYEGESAAVASTF
jgi:hypothetical protein